VLRRRLERQSFFGERFAGSQSSIRSVSTSAAPVGHSSNGETRLIVKLHCSAIASRPHLEHQVDVLLFACGWRERINGGSAYAGLIRSQAVKTDKQSRKQERSVGFRYRLDWL